VNVIPSIVSDTTAFPESWATSVLSFSSSCFLLCEEQHFNT
jgi:hypothetical protein